MHNFDVVIIGAGAAGLMCAATAGQRGRKVLLVDHAESVGEKIRISGGGRCNFTNLHTSEKNFISQNPHFCVSALKRFTSQDFISLVKKHQIDFHEKTLGQLFCDISSKQIIKMLLDECALGKVEIWLETKVDDVKSFYYPNSHSCNTKPHFCHPERSEGSHEFPLQEQEQPPEILRCAQDDNGVVQDDRSEAQDKKGGACDNKEENHNDSAAFYVQTSKGKVSCKSLVIATGGLSIPKMGATGFGYDLARQFGLKITQTYPALVPFTFEEKFLLETKNLSGIAVNAIVSCGKINFREAILFTHRGMSGPAILQISSYWKSGEKITVNLVPEIDIFTKLIEEKKSNPRQELQSFLAQFLPKALANFLAQKIPHKGNLADLSNQKIKEISDLVNRFSFVPSGTEGYAKAEVTLGGIDVNEISSKTFEAKKVPNLFFIGEVLDVTGWLGGFNFQWAWASGRVAGQYC